MPSPAHLEPTNFVILRIFLTKFGDFCKIWILVKFEILNPKISKFEILNPNTKISNLDTKCLNFDDFCYKFEENFTEIDKIGDISKFEILNPKIQNLKSLTLKSKIFIFDKIWQKIKIPPRWFIITLRFYQNSMVKILKNLSQYGVTTVTNFFQNFEVDTKIPKSPKLALITKILNKMTLKRCAKSSHMNSAEFCRRATRFQSFVIPDGFLAAFWFWNRSQSRCPRNSEMSDGSSSFSWSKNNRSASKNERQSHVNT